MTYSDWSSLIEQNTSHNNKSKSVELIIDIMCYHSQHRETKLL